MRFITEKPWPGLIDRMAATDFLPMPPKLLKEQGVQGTPTDSSCGGNKALEAKIAQAVTVVDPKKRIEAWAEIQQMVGDEVPWVFLWQQHDISGVAAWIDWNPRAG